MDVSMTIRDVPEETSAQLGARPARTGQSLEDYVRGQLVALAQWSSPDILWDRVQHRVGVTGSSLPLEAVMEFRDADRR